MNLEQLLDTLERDPQFRDQITSWTKVPPGEPQFAPIPSFIRPDLAEALESRGICQLYSHQAEALNRISRGENVVVATPTASGKSLCYVLPVLNRILSEPNSRSVFLFPTKALAQDQREEMKSWIEVLGADIRSHTYDGDTPASARRTIRSAGHIVMTNPDMLHTGILPHHTKWVRLFENLEFVIIDELHTYRGVFGSHVANVLRRLQRVARFYGSDPAFIACSATMANPLELAQNLTGRKFHAITESGSPGGERHIIFYNPPVVNRELGIRQSSILAAQRIVRRFLTNHIQTIIFARSRLRVEVLLSYLRRSVPRANIRGYRGGYLPGQRREIERGLRSKAIDAVVATNALELGIDIGSLEASVLVGYPGNIASTWQQMGRAGRTDRPSASILVASSNALDQHIIDHPEYFFAQSPENALINPDNLLILVSHIKCAAFELPFTSGEVFGAGPVDEILSYLSEHRILHRSGDTWHWMAESFPAEEISLRSAAAENVVIVDTTQPEPQIIGEVDQFSAPMLVHEGAIYLHESRQYQVEKLDLKENKAYVRQVRVNYYTDASLAVDVRILDLFREERTGGTGRFFGETQLTAQPTTYKKIRFSSHDNIGWGRIHLPPREMHTSAYWMTLEDEICGQMGRGEVEAGIMGLANLVRGVAPLFLYCDPRDLYVVPEIRSPQTKRPTIFVCDAYPGGIGLAERLYGVHDDLMQTCAEVMRGCSCERGCPSCVGAAGEVGALAKESAGRILRKLTG
ncbi:MAG: DEAD/DEAH box helicase [Bacillota bacterium]